ncbi:patronin-like [Ctenocephalides felis]|uniref:patronin-like n=1 Tax=Ctenocephalides felis TaxID=7515 RepID=UPI000E6E56EB|nr:patronin-like [Ctenocephalides felis]
MMMDMNNRDNKYAMDAQDSYDTRQAKQRASVKWLLAKAYNNRVPENMREPFYRDHEDREQLRPQIATRLASCELYGLALSSAYGDPLCRVLGHQAVLTALARKGCLVQSNRELTETVLIQTNPLRIDAHMCVIESIMAVYAKEVCSNQRVSAALDRMTRNAGVSINIGAEDARLTPVAGVMEHETELLRWVDRAAVCLAARNRQNGEEKESSKSLSEFPRVREYKDLCDGIALAALVSFYCPDELPADKIQLSNLPTVQQSVHNLSLVQQFSQNALPFSVFHMTPEDITYMRGAMKQNLVVFLADLFTVLEIHPAKCVRYAGSHDDSESSSYVELEQTTAVVVASRRLPLCHAHRMQNEPQIPDLRGGAGGGAGGAQFVTSPGVSRSLSSSHIMRSVSVRSSSPSASTISEPNTTNDCESMFPVHRGRAVPTLGAQLMSEGYRDIPAGRPSTASTNPTSQSGSPMQPQSRSRRNSITDDRSQLTVENFGGSREHLDFIGRNIEKEVGQSLNRTEPNLAVRSTVQDARGSLRLYDNDTIGDGQSAFTVSDRDHTPKITQMVPPPTQTPPMLHQRFQRTMSQERDVPDGETTTLGYRDIKNPEQYRKGYSNQSDNNLTSFMNTSQPANSNGEKRTTTWQQQSYMNTQDDDSNDPNGGQNANNGGAVAVRLNDIRLKLEEKRRRIECEKREMEMAVSVRRRRLGEKAFLRHVSKSKSATDTTEMADSIEMGHNKEQDISEEPQYFVENRRTPDSADNIDLEQYQHSIAQMNYSLQDIQSDIQRLATQQDQIRNQSYMQQQQQQQQQQQPSHAMEQNQPQTQFFLHEPVTTHQRRTWGSQSNLNSFQMPNNGFVLHEPQHQPQQPQQHFNQFQAQPHQYNNQMQPIQVATHFGNQGNNQYGNHLLQQAQTQQGNYNQGKL